MSQLLRCTQQLSTEAGTAPHMDPGSIYLDNTVRPKVEVLQTVAGPHGQSRMVYEHKAPSLEGGRTSGALTPSQLTFSNVFQVSSSQVSQVLPMLQPIPYRALVVLWKRGFEEPRRTLPMEQFMGGIAS